MNKKFSIFLYLFILVAVLIMFAGTSYAYYLQFHKKENNVTVKNVNLLVEYEKGSTLNLKNMEFDKEYEYSFNVVNDSKDEIGEYKLVLEIITPLENMIKEDFVYSLESESKSKDDTNILVNKKNSIVPVSNQELGVGKITPLNSHSYTLLLKINGGKLDKNYLDNRIFVGKIKVVSNN